MTSQDKLWLAICAYFEARSDGIEAMTAVCHVVLNRQLSRALATIKAVVLQPWQFSWANPFTTEGRPLPSIKEYTALEQATTAVDNCLQEREAGNTLDGAEYYYADYIEPPTWSKDMTFITQIGRHLFYKA